ncbi:MAG: endonuclease/exonuclease/phosphatase family protein, partial [Spirochaetaceae bacterium]|nr:endonuclease/exonuclease/phosphatase family protein [Spirochaetaceae bacterium]
WPTRLFMLRRCISVSSYDTGIPGRSLYLANIHLSAYDDGGLRRQQLEYVKTWMNDLYKEGHYIILGGDWNSTFPKVGFDDFAPYTTTEENLFWIQKIPDNWTPENWQWGWDPEVPSCRTLDQAYVPGENYLTIIDGFLVSPNVEIEEVQTSDEAFKYSDHNPVSLNFYLKP